MKKSVKSIISGLLIIPMLAIGLIMIPTPAGAIVSPPYNPSDCTDANLAPSAGDLKLAAYCNGIKVGGPTELFGPEGVLTTVINIALYLIGAISVLMLIIGGIRYTISGGNKDSVSGAKNTILYAVIGVVVALLAYAIVNFVLVNLTA